MTSTATTTHPPSLRWWQHGWRLLSVWLAGAGLFLVIFAFSPAGQEPAGSYPVTVDLLLLTDVLLGQVAVALVTLRRRWPAPVAVVTTLATALSAFAAPAALLAVTSLATRRSIVPLGVALAASVGAGISYELLVQPWVAVGGPESAEPLALWANVAITTLLWVVAMLVGWNLGVRRELLESYRLQADTSRREQAVRVAQGRMAERARIAREMHDVMGHRLSLVAMHAGALAHRPDLTVEERTASAEVVRSGVHEALEELREVLGVLRVEEDPVAAGGGATDGGQGSGADTAFKRPQPTLTDIPTLAAEATSSGQAVSLRADPGLWARSVGLPTVTGRHAYRVVQEALTNARKHAPDAEVEVRVDGRPGHGLSLTVRNPTGTPDRAPDGGGDGGGDASRDVTRTGLGLTGMAERVHLAGGEIDVGIDDDHFVVRVRLPWPQEVVDEPE